jgi:hypothetical protein
VTAEFWQRFQPQSTETLYAPFRDEKGHGIIFREAKQSLQQAGNKIKDYWSSLLEYGGINALMRAEMTKEPQLYDSKDVEGNPIRYLVRYKGIQIDKLMQPVDLFLFVKSEVDETPNPSTIAVATYRGDRQRYSQIVAFIAKDERGAIELIYLHFIKGKLVHLAQLSKPQILLPSLRRPDARQFFSVESGAVSSDNENILRLEAGLEDDDRKNFHIYCNFGGDLITTQNLRVNDLVTGEIELINIERDGTILTNQFYLPRAIVNIANFEPATRN